MATAENYDLTSVQFLENPARTYNLWWEQGDLVYSQVPFIGKTWFVTRFDAAREVLRDSERFARQADRAGLKAESQLPWWFPGIFMDLASNMLMVDDPEHRRLRGIVDSAFARRNIEGLRAQTEETAEELLDAVDPEQPVEMVGAYARELPMRMICILLGVPAEERRLVMKNASRLTSATSPAAFLLGMPGLYRMRRYLWAKFDKVRAEPETGLISYLTEIAESGDRLSRDELTSMVFLLFLAGHETTTHLISGSIASLIDNPVQKELLLGDWSLLPGAVEEFLRFMSPVHMTKPRFVTEDLEYRGTRLRRGEMVTAHLGAANWDPRMRDRPSELDISRRPNPHLSFSTGIHTCVGLQLARLEAQVALKALFTRFPNLQLAAGRNSLPWKRRIGLRAYSKVLLDLRP